jgi:hypothetical protein
LKYNGGYGFNLINPEAHDQFAARQRDRATWFSLSDVGRGKRRRASSMQNRRSRTTR